MTIIDLLGDDHARIAGTLEAAGAAGPARLRFQRLVARHVTDAERLFAMLEGPEDLRPALEAARSAHARLDTIARGLDDAGPEVAARITEIGVLLARHDVAVRALYARAAQLLPASQLESAFYEVERNRDVQSATDASIFPATRFGVR